MMADRPLSTPERVAAAPIRVLFVDDEPRILDGLRRVLHGRVPETTLAFAGGGEAALAELERAPCDLVVTDLRMPGLAGVELLERLRAIAPAAARVVLSGQDRGEVSARAAAAAHQMLSKPCDPAAIAARIGFVGALRGLVPDPEHRARLGGLQTLISRPTTLETLHRVLRDPAVRPSSLLPLVLTDVALAAAVAKLAATGCFGARPAGASLEAATSGLGIESWRALDRLGALARPIPDDPEVAGQIEALNAAAVRDARRARQAAGPGERGERAYAVAMFGSLGELAWMSAALDADATPYAEIAPPPLAGAYLLGLWGGPREIVERLAGGTLPGETATGRGRSAA